MARKRSSCAIVSLIVLCGLIGFSIWLWMSHIEPTATFYRSERAALPQFDDLNLDIFAELPEPNGVVEIDRRRQGITDGVAHGRYLIVEYQMGTVTDNDIYTHYQGALLSRGWTPSSINTLEYSLYYRDTACISVPIFPNAGEYRLEIWHDFLDQTFSPSMPPPSILDIYELGKTPVLRCPPQ